MYSICYYKVLKYSLRLHQARGISPSWLSGPCPSGWVGGKTFQWAQPQSAYRGRVDIWGSVSALSAGAYITTLYVMVDIVKGGACQAGLIFPLWWNVRQIVALPLFVYLCELNMQKRVAGGARTWWVGLLRSTICNSFKYGKNDSHVISSYS
jgi:hypothetical protein